MTAIETIATSQQPLPIAWGQLPRGATLFNRGQFLDHIRRELDRTRKCLTARFDVLCVEPDCYWAMAMESGAAAADELAIAVGDCIAGLLSPRDAISSMGGGRIAVLLEVAGVARTTDDVVNDIQRRLMVGFPVAGRHMFTTASIGIARMSSSYAAPDLIIRDAGLALARAKVEGRARCARFSRLRDDHPANLLDMETDLRSALTLGQFELDFQPMVSRETGSVDAFEALIRWRHPVRGLQQPPEFLHALEDAGLAGVVGEWIVRTAVVETARWREASGRTIPVTLNLSGSQIESGIVTAAIDRALDEGLDPLSIILEIGEEVFLRQRESVIAALTPLRDRGVRVVLDGFGTGPCCLGYMAELPIDAIKLDIAFADSLARYSDEHEMVRSIVDFAHGMDLDVIAGKVELGEQLDEARSLCCDEVQGFLISSPVDAAAAWEMVDKGWTATLEQPLGSEITAT